MRFKDALGRELVLPFRAIDYDQVTAFTGKLPDHIRNHVRYRILYGNYGGFTHVTIAQFDAIQDLRNERE